MSQYQATLWLDQTTTLKESVCIGREKKKKVFGFSLWFVKNVKRFRLLSSFLLLGFSSEHKSVERRVEERCEETVKTLQKMKEE